MIIIGKIYWIIIDVIEYVFFFFCKEVFLKYRWYFMYIFMLLNGIYFLWMENISKGFVMKKDMIYIDSNVVIVLSFFILFFVG